MPSLGEVFPSSTVSGFALIPNPDLRAESSESYEIGVTQLLGEHAVLDAAAFKSEFSGMIEPEPVIDEQTVFIQFENLEHSRVTGMEIKLNVAGWKRKLLGSLGYTYVSGTHIGEVKNTCVDNPSYIPTDHLAYRPAHTLYLSGTVSAGPIEATLDYRYLSTIDEVKMYCNDSRVPRKILDGRVRWGYGGFDVILTVQNALQYHYTDIEKSLGPIRSYTLTLLRDFDA